MIDCHLERELSSNPFRMSAFISCFEWARDDKKLQKVHFHHHPLSHHYTHNKSRQSSRLVPLNLSEGRKKFLKRKYSHFRFFMLRSSRLSGCWVGTFECSPAFFGLSVSKHWMEKRNNSDDDEWSETERRWKTSQSTTERRGKGVESERIVEEKLILLFYAVPPFTYPSLWHTN